MIKKITIDTNSDIYNESSNLFLEIVNNESNTVELSYPTFREILDEDNLTPTGIYFCEIDLANGNYYVTVKHNTLTKTGSIHFVVTDDDYKTLEDTITELVNEYEDNYEDDSMSFS